MRQLVYLLLVANLVYLGWNVFDARSTTEEEPRLPAIPASVNPLVLLQEKDANTDSAGDVSSRAGDDSTIADEISSRVDEVSIVADEIPGRADEVSIVADERPDHADGGSIITEEISNHVDEAFNSVEDSSTSADETSSGADEDPVLVDEASSGTDEGSIIAADAPSGTDEVSILVDEASSGTDEVSSIDDLTAEQPPGAGAAVLCQALGPFLAVDDLQAVESRLVDLDLQPTRRGLESRELIGYWVYLTAMSQQDVQAVLAILKEHKDKEYYVGKTNFISLGTFKGMDRAERRVKDTREMGLDPVLQERYGTRSSWWLDIQSDGSAAAQLSAIAKSRSELQLVDLACY
jgi:hypothetical protein